MGRWIVLAHDGVGGEQQALTRFGMNDEGAERGRTRAAHCEGGKLVDFAHSSLVELSLLRMDGGRTFSPKT